MLETNKQRGNEMIDSEKQTFNRKCMGCCEMTVFVGRGMNEATCTNCGAVNKIKWLPKTYIEAK